MYVLLCHCIEYEMCLVIIQFVPHRKECLSYVSRCNTAIFCVIVVTGEVIVSEVCLGCICQAVSQCNLTIGCTEEDCGMFRITKPYWIDSGKPTIPLDNQEDNGGRNV